MKFHCLMIDTLKGWNGKDYDRGNQLKGLVEAEVIDKIALPIKECLDYTGIPHEDIETRKRPGFSEEKRIEQMSVGKLGFRIGVDWDTDAKNRTTVIFSHQDLAQVAREIAKVTYLWARKINPTQLDCGAVDMINTNLPPHLVFMPFSLNGDKAWDMSGEIQLTELGKKVGLVIGDWLKLQNPSNVGFRPRQLFPRPHEQK